MWWMMTSDPAAYSTAYVWIWLPGSTSPVVAGRLAVVDGQFQFNYGRSYLDRADAISIYEPELPLQPGLQHMPEDTGIPSCLRDAGPDSWGQKVILDILDPRARPHVESEDIFFLLESGADRIGALDFRLSPDGYEPRQMPRDVSLSELLAAVARFEEGEPLKADMARVLRHCASSVGGARPKALVDGSVNKRIAKFSFSTDSDFKIKAEFVAMRLAQACGLNVAPVSLARVEGKDILMIERFDRIRVEEGWLRKPMISAFTLFGPSEISARHASYLEFTDIIRHRFSEPKATLRELFGRLCFNILCSNTDDHARNHAAFWDGRELALTPAYDICPQPRIGDAACQAMAVGESTNLSMLCICLDTAHRYLLSRGEALAIMRQQIETIGDRWSAVCGQAVLSADQRTIMMGNKFLSPFAFLNLDHEASFLAELAESVRTLV